MTSLATETNYGAEDEHVPAHSTFKEISAGQSQAPQDLDSGQAFGI